MEESTTQSTLNTFTEIFSNLGDPSHTDKLGEAKRLVMAIRSKEAQNAYYNFFTEKLKKFEEENIEAFAHPDQLDRHSCILIFMSLTNLSTRFTQGAELVIRLLESGILNQILAKIGIDESKDYFLKGNKQQNEKFQILDFGGNKKIKKYYDEEEMNLVLEEVGGEWETKARRVSLHFLVNLVANFEPQEEDGQTEQKDLKDTYEQILTKITSFRSQEGEQTQGSILNSIFQFSYIQYLNPSTQRLLSIFNLEKAPEDHLQATNAKKYDQWFYFLHTKISHQSHLIPKIINQYKNYYTRGQELPHPLVNFMSWLINFMQKTVEKKIHYSVVKDVNLKKLQTDEFYIQNAKNASRGDRLGLQVTLSDVDFFIAEFVQSLEALEKLNPDKVEEDWEAAVNLVEYLHLIIKFMIPVNFLGGYNREVQVKFFPKFLDCLCRMLLFLDRKYYKKHLVTVKGEVRGVIRAAIGKPKEEDFKLNLYPEKPNFVDSSPNERVLPQRAFYELNTDIVRLTSNLIHTSTEAQDYLIDSDFLLLLLSFSGFDKYNPLAREATIVLIRYVTDSNQRAREVISQMEVKKLDPESVEAFKGLGGLGMEMGFM